MITRLSFIFLLCATTALLVACDDSVSDKNTPKALDMMPLWNANSFGARVMTGAIFEHDDHDNTRCVTCHTNGEKAPVTLPAGSTIYGVRLATNAAHNFCVSCHNTVNDAPRISQATCRECHKGSTAPYSGGVIDMKNNWARFFPANTAFTMPKVLLVHFSHKNNNCTQCHSGNPSNIDGSYPITPTGMAVPEDNATNAKDKIHNYCFDCHKTVASAPQATACASCHK